MKLEHIVFLTFTKKDFIFGWVLSHVGISDNENADSAVESALEVPLAKVGVQYKQYTLWF